MNEIDRKLRFANLMAKACAAYQAKKLDVATMAIYFEYLEGVPMDDVERNLQNHIQTQRFFPKVSDLVQRHEEVSRPRLGPTYVPHEHMDLAMRVANLSLMRVINEVGGVDKHQLKLLVMLKNALVEDLDGKHDEVWIDDVHRQLTDLAKSSEKDKRDSEAFDAWTAFCVRQKISMDRGLQVMDKT